MPLYDATREQLRALDINGKDANRLLRCLCTLADYEDLVKKALTESGRQRDAHGDVCYALRWIVDGDGR